jgi:hypothetical protein
MVQASSIDVLLGVSRHAPIDPLAARDAGFPPPFR